VVICFDALEGAIVPDFFTGLPPWDGLTAVFRARLAALSKGPHHRFGGHEFE
jgi:hypothetical protein